MSQIQILLFENAWAVYVDCAECGAHVKEDDSTEIDDRTYCADCRDELFDPCDRCDGPSPTDEGISVRVVGRHGEYNTDQLWCTECADNHAFRCDDCGDYYHNDARVPLAGGGEICRNCYNNSYFSCEGCGHTYHNDDMGYSNDYCYCTDCGRDNDDEGDFSPQGFRSRGKITEVGSARCFGVEIETNECDGYGELNGHPAWGAKDDCTVDGKEMVSAILSGDDGLAAIADLADLADLNGWEVGRNCGFHLHLDARNESDDSLYAMAFAFRAAQEVFLGCVESHRASGSYSRACNWECADLNADRTFSNWSGYTIRYNWLNVVAFHAHGTFEIRAHEGTCDGRAICNWVKACLRFADWAACTGFAGVKEALAGKDNAEMFDFIAKTAWQDESLRAYYAEKAARLHGVTW